MEGAKVVVATRRSDEGQETIRLVRQTGSDGLFVKTDVAKEADVRAAGVKGRGLGLDALGLRCGAERRNWSGRPGRTDGSHCHVVDAVGRQFDSTPAGGGGNVAVTPTLDASSVCGPLLGPQKHRSSIVPP